MYLMLSILMCVGLRKIYHRRQMNLCSSKRSNKWTRHKTISTKNININIGEVQFCDMCRKLKTEHLTLFQSQQAWWTGFSSIYPWCLRVRKSATRVRQLLNHGIRDCHTICHYVWCLGGSGIQTGNFTPCLGNCSLRQRSLFQKP